MYANIDINDDWLDQAMANDNDLFVGMVEQTDSDDMNSDANECTQEPIYEHTNCTNNDCGHTNQAMHKDASQSMECCSSTASLPSDNDPFTIAFIVLETVAMVLLFKMFHMMVIV